MPLNHPGRTGLRPLWYNARSAGKVQITVNPGETIHVSDEMAAQLQAADGHFHDGETPSGFDPDPPPVEPADEPADEPKPAAKLKASTVKKV